MSRIALERPVVQMNLSLAEKTSSPPRGAGARLVNLNVRKSQPPPECKVYTPTFLADAMVRSIDPCPTDMWLDPCMGPGAFISVLRDNGLSNDRIVGLDIDVHPSAVDAEADTVRGVDFFDWCTSTRKRFNKVVANPPYVALSKLDADLQQSVQRFRDGRDPSFGLRSNYWCAFLAASLDILSPNGSLAFVLPAAWDYALYARTLRQRVFSSFKFVEVHRSLKPLFPEVGEGRVVLVAKGYLQKPQHASRIDHPTVASLVAALTGSHIQSPAFNLRASTAFELNSTRFGDLFSVGIGCVTGNVDYFLLTESQRLEHELPVEALQPVLSKARHLTEFRITRVLWDQLRRADERVWLFSPDERAQRSKAVRAYLKYGEKICNLDGYKLRNRDPWYQVPGIRIGVGFMSGMSSVGPWLALRSMRGLAATNTLYIIASTESLTLEEQAAWSLSLLSTETRRQVQTHIRRYPDGLSKLEPHDIAQLRLLKPKRTTGSLEDYQRAVDLLLKGNADAASAIADKWVVHSRRKQSAATTRGAV